MARRRRQYHRPSNIPKSPIGGFIIGFIAGAGAVSAELLLFVFNGFYDALIQVEQSINPPSSSLSSYFSFTMVLLALCGILHYFLLGLIDSESVSMGFLAGDLVVLVLLAQILWHISPSIVIGMIFALFIVICGFFLRSFARGDKPPQYDEWYY